MNTPASPAFFCLHVVCGLRASDAEQAARGRATLTDETLMSEKSVQISDKPPCLVSEQLPLWVACLAHFRTDHPDFSPWSRPFVEVLQVVV